MRYDGLRNSALLDVLAAQLRYGLIDKTDLDILSEETKAQIISWASATW